MDDEYQPDIVRDGFRHAKYQEAVANLRWAINVALASLISIPVILLLILWRVW